MQSKKVLLIGSYSPENEGKPEIIDRDYYRQGWIFKDEDAFQNRPDDVCYIPEDVNIDCESETLKELALYPGEPEAYCYIDSTEGEYLPICGGYWSDTSYAGVFDVTLLNPRTHASGSIGFRSAYFRKLKTE